MLHPQPGYPFTLDLAIDYELSEHGLTVRTTATNVGDSAAPYGCGAHPYLRLGTDVVDPLVLRIPGRVVLRSPTTAGCPSDPRRSTAPSSTSASRA